jgi:hypothetical protein
VSVPGEPIQLINQNKEGILAINNEALEIIAKLNGNLAVCAVVGPYRSGKSYILNHLLNRRRGFELGGRVESCTRGIWMWNYPIKLRNKNGEMNLLILDTEGLSSPDATTKLDNQIFVLSILLSSLFLYNTNKAIDRDAIKKLAIMSQLSEHIKNGKGLNKNDEKDMLKLNLPAFYWIVRDFFLSLDSKTPNEYLNESLELKARGQNDVETQEANVISESIKSSFSTLECFCLPIPIENGIDGRTRDETLRNLDDVPFKNLNQQFYDGIVSLCAKIKSDIAPKSAFSVILSAPTYVKYVENIVDELNNSKQVNLTESLTSSLKYVSEKSLVDALDMYRAKFDEVISRNKWPLRWQAFDDKAKEIYEECLKHLSLNLNGPRNLTEPFFKTFNDSILKEDGLYSHFKAENKKKIINFNKRKLDMYWKRDMHTKYFDQAALNRNNNPNLDNEFERDYKNFRKLYGSTAFDAPQEPEMSVAFEEWYREQNIEYKILSIRSISEIAKERVRREREMFEKDMNNKKLQSKLDEEIKLNQTREGKLTDLNNKIQEIENRHREETENLKRRLEERNNNNNPQNQEVQPQIRILEHVGKALDSIATEVMRMPQILPRIGALLGRIF